jgi:preprotein translocase subunit SecG
MDIILSTIIILASVLLIFVVYIQNPKGGGLSSDFGSPSQLGGVQKTTEFIDKATWGLAIAIVLCSVIMTVRQPRAAKPVKQKQQTEQPGQDGQQPAGQGNTQNNK